MSSIVDPFNDSPPEKLTSRIAHAAQGGLITYRFCGDRKDTDYARWFSTKKGTHPVRSGNEVEYLVDGPSTYQEMARVLRTATDPNSHFIYLLGWICYDNFPLASDGATLQTLLTEASGQGVQIRAMLWTGNTKVNFATCDHIQKLAHGAAILDNRTLTVGSHHQKVLVVNGTEGLTAFLGGIDINPDRVFTKGIQGSEQPGAPMHDVHCRIRGPAAADVLKTFVERWNDHPYSSLPFVGKGHLTEPTSAETQPTPGRLYVQIGRTYGNAAKHGFLVDNLSSIPSYVPLPSPLPQIPLLPRSDSYSFAIQGETSAAEMFLHAIKTTKRFIYIEDQYLINPEASAALTAAVSRLEHITILIPDSPLSDFPDVCKRRLAFTKPLRDAGGPKVRIYCRAPVGPDCAHSYVHAKTWIFDDRFAIIGSANCNLRSWTNDSEIVAGIYDESTEDKVSYTFAHRLRIKLWAEHLDMESPDGFAALTDPIASAVHWNSSHARVKLFNEYENTDDPNKAKNVPPHFVADPDGR